MRSSIAKATGVALIAGAVLLGAAGTASANHCPKPHGALAVGGDATSIGDDAAALAVGGDAFAMGGDNGKDDNKGDDENGAKALAVGGDATAIGDDPAALAVGGDALAVEDDNGGDNGGDDGDCP